MAAEEANQKMTAARFAQLATARIPFDPVSGAEMTGMNVRRIQQAMSSFNWGDPRFVSEAEAARNGWEIQSDSSSVTIRVRESERDAYEDVVLFNAGNVVGMPSLEAMLGMTDEQLTAMQAQGAADLAREELNDGLAIGPSRDLVVESENKAEQSPVDARIAGGKTEELDVGQPGGRFVVMADYWRAGLHNAKGITLANELNQEIAKSNLTKDRQAVEDLLNAHPHAKRFKLTVVTEEQYLNDPHRKTNAAEPRTLLNGAYVRDKNNSYCPKEGGKAILEDRGDSLQLKTKSKEGYAAAMELAIAKGWTAIELKGKPKQLADAWLEAKLKGLNVVNYSPTKKDMEKYSERLAQLSAERAKAAEKEAGQPGPAPQAVERVVNRPFVDANGQNKTATITYTVYYEQGGAKERTFDDAKEAAKTFHAVAGSALPSVMRTVTRADGVVDERLMVAGTEAGRAPTEWSKSADAKLDAVFSAALGEVIEEERAVAALSKGAVVSEGIHAGMILGIQDGQVIQKTGRGPEEVVRHDITKLSRAPKVGVVENIVYERGTGIVEEKGQERASAGRELVR